MNHTPCDIKFEELVSAYFDCRKNKRNTQSALEFEIDLEHNLWELYNQLRQGTYKIGRSICFVVKQPRTREVWAAQFRDRVVHHLIYNRLSDKWNRSFTADSCACIPGRGTMYGAIRLEKHIRSITNNWSKDAWYLKCDLQNFFVSIDKNVLWRLMDGKIKIPWLNDLTKMVLFHDPRVDPVFKSSEAEMAEVPEYKRLLLAGENRGLPIGNLTSQFFANILLDCLDKFVKHKLKVRKYVRYVDDCIFLSTDKAQLRVWYNLVTEFVKTLGLKFNPKKCFIQRVSRGVSFVGQTIYPFRRVPLRNTQMKCFKRCSNATPSTINSFLAYMGQSGKNFNLKNKMLDIAESSGITVCRKRLITQEA
jgi:hypothetical protein